MITSDSRYRHRVDTSLSGGMDLDRFLLHARRRGLVVTETGVVIGIAHQRLPSPEIGSQAEAIQKALLRQHRPGLRARRSLPSVEPEQLVIPVGRRPLWWRAWQALRSFWSRA
ncbi:MAG TPA: hypothetical protein PKJ45_10275 [Rubrivivax sp.]|nr:hypothetical protein [Rubrivivax sp.]